MTPDQFDLFGPPPEKKRNIDPDPGPFTCSGLDGEVEFEEADEGERLSPGHLPDWATDEWFKQPDPGEPVKLTDAEIRARLDKAYQPTPMQSCAVCGETDRRPKCFIIWLGGVVHVDCHWEYMEKRLDERAREEGWPICVVCKRGHPPVRHATLDGPIHFCCAEHGEEVIDVEWKAARPRAVGTVPGRGTEPDGRTGPEGDGGVDGGGVRAGEPEVDGDVWPVVQHAGDQAVDTGGVRAEAGPDHDGVDDDGSSGQAEVSGQGEEVELPANRGGKFAGDKDGEVCVGPGPCPICGEVGGSNRVHSARWNASVHSDCIERWLKEQRNGDQGAGTG